MNMRKMIFGLIPFVMILSACQPSQPKGADQQKPVVTVSILPQKYFVERIGGEQFQVQLMVPPGASPVSYEPSPGQMQKLEHSSGYIRIGHIVFERVWMDKFLSVNPDLKVFDQSKGVDLIRKGAGGHTSEGRGVDPHIWTSPGQVKTQVRNIRDFLSQLDSAHSSTYRSNTRDLLEEIDSLDTRIRQRLAGLENTAFLIFHPALSYFARDYELNQISMQQEGKEPTASRIKQVIDQSDAARVEAVFIQKQFSTDEARALARELNARVVQIDPLAYNWMENMDAMSRAIAKALEKNREKQQE